MANIFKRKKKNQEKPQNQEVNNNNVDKEKNEDEKYNRLPRRFSKWGIVKHTIGGLSVIGCAVVGILAALAGFLLPAFIAWSLAIGFGGIFAKELVEDYQEHQQYVRDFYSTKEDLIQKDLEAEQKKEAQLNSEIEKIQEENKKIEKKRGEAHQRGANLIGETFGTAEQASVQEVNLEDRKKTAHKEGTTTINSTFNSQGAEMEG